MFDYATSFLECMQDSKGNERRKKKKKEEGSEGASDEILPVVSASTLVLGDPHCNPIEVHHGPASCLLSSHRHQVAAGWRSQRACGLVAVEVRKGKEGKGRERWTCGM